MQRHDVLQQTCADITGATPDTIIIQDIHHLWMVIDDFLDTSVQVVILRINIIYSYDIVVYNVIDLDQ